MIGVFGLSVLGFLVAGLELATKNDETYLLVL